MFRGTAITTILRAPEAVFAAISDVTRMGEWSPECTGGRWVPPADGPAVGATFEGDNIAKLGPLTVKRWTTTSEVIQSSPGELFEFVSEDFTRWRYELVEIEGATRVTETFHHEPFQGFQHLLYNKLLNRDARMVEGMEQTLERLKNTLEAEAEVR